MNEEDKRIVENVTNFLYQYPLTKYDNCKNCIVTCDKDVSYRVKDFAIDFKNCDWFRTEWYNMNNHLDKRTKIYLNIITQALKNHSSELGITGVQRRVFGIIFNARKNKGDKYGN